MVLLGKREHVKYVFGCSGLLSRGKYIYESYSHIAHRTESEEYHYTSDIMFFNIHNGAKFKLGQRFFFMPALLINFVAAHRTILNGYHRLSTSDPYTGQSTDRITQYDNQKVDTTMVDISFSLQPRIGYTLFNKKTPVEIYLFRNFNFTYRLPWWGLGVQVGLNHKKQQSGSAAN